MPRLPEEFLAGACRHRFVSIAFRSERRRTGAIMVPVVVIGESLNTLGVVRSLARGGMPIYLVCSSRRCAPAWSRYCRVMPRAPLNVEAILNAVITIGAHSGHRPVVLLGSDQDVKAISERRDEFAAVCRLTLPPPEMVRTLGDKALFQVFAEREGFPVPKSVIVNGAADLPALSTLSMPVVIKPANKDLVLAHRVERAVYANNFEQAAAVATRMLTSADTLVIQEWIDGADSDIFFCLFTCDVNNRMMGVFVGRKIVCDPPAVGSTAVCIAAPEMERELIAVTTRLIERVNYQGLGSIEFKRCRKTRRFLIVEPTVGRTDWQEEISTLCGVNIPLIAYQTELDLAHAASGNGSRSIAWRSSAGFRIPVGVLPHGTRVYDGYLRFSDPLPGLYHYAVEAFLDRVIRRTKRMIRESIVGKPTGQ